MRSRFCIVILLWVCFIFAEHLHGRTPLEGGLLLNRDNFIYDF